MNRICGNLQERPHGRRISHRTFDPFPHGHTGSSTSLEILRGDTETGQVLRSTVPIAVTTIHEITQPLTDGIVFVVEEDMRLLASLGNLLTAVGYQVKLYDSGELFLAAPNPDLPCCVILDLNPETSDGLEVRRQLNREAPMPVIFLTGSDNIRTTVQAMKAGACDLLAKPILEDELLSVVQSALQRSKLQSEERKIARGIRHRYMTLTRREKDVLPFIVRGLLNKQTAYELGISEITIRIHRGNIMKKMRADSLADLVRLAGKLGIPDDFLWRSPSLTEFAGHY